MRRGFSIAALLLALVGSLLLDSLGGAAQGTVYTDSMDSAETGLFREGGPDSDVFRYAYEDGVFMMEAFPSDYAGEFYAYAATPEFLGSNTEVDTAILSDPTGRYVFVGCRAGQNDDGYLFELQVDTGDVRLWRMDPDAPTVIAASNAADVVNLGNDINRIGLQCIAQIMTGSVNGQPVLSEVDPTYASGATYIGAGAYEDSPGPVSAGFDNFEAQDLGNVQLVDAPTVTPTPALVASGETAPIRDPNIDPGGTLDDAFTISLNVPPVVSGHSDDTQVSSGTNIRLPAGVQVAEFYAEFSYTTPTLPANTGYLVGFSFWGNSSGESYDIYAGRFGSSRPRWGYGKYTSTGGYRPLLYGDMPANTLDPTPGATNFLSLTVYQGVAILSSNTYAADVVIPLEGAPLASDVDAEVGYLDPEQVGTGDPLLISTFGFSVWDLSQGVVPVLSDSSLATSGQPAVTLPLTTVALSSTGPNLPPVQGVSAVEMSIDQARAAAVLNSPLAEGFSGSFTEGDTFYAYAGAGVNLADFYTVATFTNPIDAPAPFDVGIGFRHDNASQGGLRLTIISAGTWYMQISGQEPYVNGAAASYVLTPGAANTIEVLVQGPTGTVAINGVLLPQFDLSTIPNRGDISLGAGFFHGDIVTGRAVSYSDWWIYPIDPFDIPRG